VTLRHTALRFALGALLGGTALCWHAPQAHAAGNPAPLVGTWVNSNAATRDLVKVAVSDQGGVLAHMWGACAPTLCDWGSNDVVVSTTLPPVGTVGQVCTPTGFLSWICEQVTLHLSSDGTTVTADVWHYYNDFSGRSPLHTQDTLRR
jgi:hypothetical protein